MATETTSSEEEQEFPLSSSYRAPATVGGGGGGGRSHTQSAMDGRAMRRSSRGSFTRASLEDLLSIDPEAYQSSVWLGTEDGWCVDGAASAASSCCLLLTPPTPFCSLQHPRVPVVGQHPQPQEQHEDATFGLHPLHPVSLL